MVRIALLGCAIMIMIMITRQQQNSQVEVKSR